MHSLLSFLVAISSSSPSLPPPFRRAKALFKLVYQNIVASSKSQEGAQASDDVSDAGTSDVLGRCYCRRSRFRQPVGNYKLEGRAMGIYFTLKCPTLDKDTFPLPTTISGVGGSDGLPSSGFQH